MERHATITEEEFELVMGIFEKVTHDTTEFLHHVSLFIRSLQ
jgi:enhancer of polycomb-like protein